MNKIKRMEGRWSGSYSYDARGPIAILPPVGFTMELNPGWFGMFTGKVEDHAIELPGTGSVFGRLSYPTISFVKKMPICYVTSLDGVHKSLRRLIEELGCSCNKELPGPQIFYDGTFIESFQAEGSWIIYPQIHQLSGKRTFKTSGSQGVWQMKPA